MGVPTDANEESEPLRRPPDDAASSEARLERLERDREFLLLHSRNLERELCRLIRRRTRWTPEPAEDQPQIQGQSLRIQQLETRLAAITSAYDAVIASRTWRAFKPYRALRVLVRRLFPA